MLDLTPFIRKGVEALAPELFKTALKSASRAFQALKPYEILNFEDNFTKAYQRCTKIRTIINGDTPIDLLENYVNLSFINQNKHIDDYGLIDKIWKELALLYLVLLDQVKVCL